jgi:hypothetical protein
MFVSMALSRRGSEIGELTERLLPSIKPRVTFRKSVLNPDDDSNAGVTLFLSNRSLELSLKLEMYRKENDKCLQLTLTTSQATSLTLQVAHYYNSNHIR